MRPVSEFNDTELILIDSTGDLTTQVELGNGNGHLETQFSISDIHTSGLFTKMEKQESILPRCDHV